jgi:hypothetical protein
MVHVPLLLVIAKPTPRQTLLLIKSALQMDALAHNILNLMDLVLLMLRLVETTSEEKKLTVAGVMKRDAYKMLLAQVMNTKPLMVSVLQMELSAHKVQEKI